MTTVDGQQLLLLASTKGLFPVGTFGWVRANLHSFDKWRRRRTVVLPARGQSTWLHRGLFSHWKSVVLNYDSTISRESNGHRLRNVWDIGFHSFIYLEDYDPCTSFETRGRWSRINEFLSLGLEAFEGRIANSTRWPLSSLDMPSCSPNHSKIATNISSLL